METNFLYISFLIGSFRDKMGQCYVFGILRKSKANLIINWQMRYDGQIEILKWVIILEYRNQPL